MQLRQLTTTVKRSATLPRVSLSSQITAADAAIFVLFILGSIAGFPGFAKYSDIKNQIASLGYKPAWATLLFLFNYLLIHRKIKKTYFSAKLARLHALCINALAIVVCYVIAKIYFLSAMNILDAFIAVESALAAVYLIAQGWIDFKPDLRSLADLSNKIDVEISRIEGLPKDMLEPENLNLANDLCSKFARDIDAVLLDSLSDSNARTALILHKDKVARICEALRVPLSGVQPALRRAKESV